MTIWLFQEILHLKNLLAGWARLFSILVLKMGRYNIKKQPCIIYGQPFWLKPWKVVGFYESCSAIPIYAPNFWIMTWNWVSTFLSPRSISFKFLTNLVGTLLNFPKLWVFKNFGKKGQEKMEYCVQTVSNFSYSLATAAQIS